MRARASSQVALIAAREVEVGFRSKQFYISMAISLVLVVAIVLVPRLISGGESSTVVALSGSAAEREGYAELVGDAPGFVFVGPDEDADVAIDLAASPPVVLADTSSALTAAGPLVPYVALFAERAAAEGTGSAPATAPRVAFLEDDSARGAKILLAYVLSLLLFLQIAGLGSSVAQGTLEEKGNRVVDVLFPKVPPVRILVGKVVGIGIFGTLQMILLGVVGVIAVFTGGEEALRGDILPAVAVSLGWFVLGYLFVGFLSGAVASTVTRPDQLSTVMLPLQLLNGAVFVTAVLSLQAPDADWVKMLSVVPPFSAILMPIRVAAGEIAPWEVVVAVAVALLAIGLCLAIGGRVYRRSVVGRSIRMPVIDAGRG